MKVDRTLVHIVDDNATFRKTIEGRLEQFGYAISTYPSAQHLLDRLPSDDAPSCILLDVRMPGMSGPELQERPGGTWFDTADHIPNRVFRHSDHCADHQGR
jgi:FixJ family two-component response regulator